MTLAIYAGTFDPLTMGHLDIIKRSLKFCDGLIIGIGINPMKKTTFTDVERIDMINKTLYQHKIYTVIIQPFQGLLVKFAKDMGANLLIRGIRSVSDFEYEITLANTNKVLAPEIETLFLPTSPNLAVVSSSMVKEIARYGGDISTFVEKPVQEYLTQFFKQ